MKHLNVVAAVILKDGKYLCMQRNTSKYDYISLKYEFPGGKIEENENETQALHREIREELSIKINIVNKIITVDHIYNDFRISMNCYLCTTNNDTIILKDHINYVWLDKNQLHTLDWAAADIPVLDLLK